MEKRFIPRILCAAALMASFAILVALSVLLADRQSARREAKLRASSFPTLKEQVSQAIGASSAPPVYADLMILLADSPRTQFESLSALRAEAEVIHRRRLDWARENYYLSRPGDGEELLVQSLIKTNASSYASLDQVIGDAKTRMRMNGGH